MTGRLLTLQILAVSSLTGAIVGGCISVAAAVLTSGSLAAALVCGAVSGADIGLVVAGAFLGLSLHAGRRPVASFVAVGPIVGLGAAASSVATGLSWGPVFMAVVMASVALGYLTTALWFYSYRRWNDRLRVYQRMAAGETAGAAQDR